MPLYPVFYQLLFPPAWISIVNFSNDLDHFSLRLRFLNLTTCTWIWMESYISVHILMMMMFTSEFQMIKSLLIFFTTWRCCFALLNLGRCSSWLLMVWLLEQKWTSSGGGVLGKTFVVSFRILFRLIKCIILKINDLVHASSVHVKFCA